MQKIYTATIIERDGADVYVRRNLCASTPTELCHKAVNSIRHFRNITPDGEVKALFDEDDIYAECVNGNSTNEPLSIAFAIDGEQELGHELLLSVAIHDAFPNPLIESFKRLNELIPWHTFGKRNINDAAPKNVLDDLVDYLKVMFGVPQDILLAYIFLGEKASSPHFLWDGLPSYEGFNVLVAQVNRILGDNDKRCTLRRAGFSASDGRPLFELESYDEEGYITDIRTLSAFECLNYAESVIEEEKGTLPF